MILKLAKIHNPSIEFDAYREMLTALPLDHKLVQKLFLASFKEVKRKDSDLKFVAAMLLIFSPKSIFLEGKTVFGVAKAITDKLNLTDRFKTSYRIRVAREVYQVDTVFKHEVDEIVKEVKGE